MSFMVDNIERSTADLFRLPFVEQGCCQVLVDRTVSPMYTVPQEQGIL